VCWSCVKLEFYWLTKLTTCLQFVSVDAILYQDWAILIEEIANQLIGCECYDLIYWTLVLTKKFTDCYRLWVCRFSEELEPYWLYKLLLWWQSVSLYILLWVRPLLTTEIAHMSTVCERIDPLSRSRHADQKSYRSIVSLWVWWSSVELSYAGRRLCWLLQQAVSVSILESCKRNLRLLLIRWQDVSILNFGIAKTCWPRICFLWWQLVSVPIESLLPKNFFDMLTGSECVDSLW
jgi:hypothetical protein